MGNEEISHDDELPRGKSARATIRLTYRPDRLDGYLVLLTLKKCSPWILLRYRPDINWTWSAIIEGLYWSFEWDVIISLLDWRIACSRCESSPTLPEYLYLHKISWGSVIDGNAVVEIGVRGETPGYLLPRNCESNPLSLHHSRPWPIPLMWGCSLLFQQNIMR